MAVEGPIVGDELRDSGSAAIASVSFPDYAGAEERLR